MDHKLKLLAYKLEPIGIPVDPVNPVITIEKILSSVIGFFSIVAIIWFTIQIIIAAYNYISSQGDKGKIEQAQKAITNGILGLVIALVAIFLVALITKLLGIDNAFNLKEQFDKLIIK